MAKYDSVIDEYKANRQALKSSSPILYALTGGDRATEYTLKNLKPAQMITETTGAVVDTAGAVVEGAFDFVAWIRGNWQLAILGIVALLVLLKD